MTKVKRRSDCPMSTALDIIGDRWSLLIVRDILIRGKRTHSGFRQSEEKIATNILGDRLALLEAEGIVEKSPNPEDGRSDFFSLTKKGMDLLPILIELTEWSGKYDPKICASSEMRARKEALVAEMKGIYRRILSQKPDETDTDSPSP